MNDEIFKQQRQEWAAKWKAVEDKVKEQAELIIKLQRKIIELLEERKSDANRS